MVRALVGTLLEVGLGKKTVADFEQIILAKDRKLAGAQAPAHGLFLVEVGYPEGLL
jgi:tRNA pseudouridine38-40 synthase